MWGKQSQKKTFTFGLALSVMFISSNALAGLPRCFMHGIITPKYDNKEKTSLSDMLRLNFDAATKLKCEQMMIAYCLEHIKGKGYSPTRLSGTFKPDYDKSEEYIYRYKENCKLETDD